MDAFSFGWMAGEANDTKKILREQNRLLEEGNDIKRDTVIQELRDEGILLPEYDWFEEKFQAELESVFADWHERHPEIIRGSGDLEKKFPEIVKAVEAMENMIEKSRISPEEFLLLYRNLYSF